MGIVLDTYAEDLYKVHAFEWDNAIKAYTHIYRLDKDYHAEVIITDEKFRIYLFDDNGKPVESVSGDCKGVYQGAVLDTIDVELEILLRERGIIE